MNADRLTRIISTASTRIRLWSENSGVSPTAMPKQTARLIWAGSVSELRTFNTLATVLITDDLLADDGYGNACGPRPEPDEPFKR